MCVLIESEIEREREREEGKRGRDKERKRERKKERKKERENEKDEDLKCYSGVKGRAKFTLFRIFASFLSPMKRN